MKRIDAKAVLRAAVILGIVVCLAVAIGGTAARADSLGAATVTASALNMRSGPSTSDAVVTCLPRGTVVLVTGESGGWYQVWYKGQSGYMSKDYLNYTQTSAMDLGTGTVTGNYVNVRSGPSTAYTSREQVNKGRTFTVTGVSGAWYQISYNGSTAYIASQYLSLGSSGTQTPAPAPQTGTGTGTQTTGVITGNYVRMRSGPSTGYAILGTYNAGTKMTITGQSGDWYAVSYNGRNGYVYKQYLSQSGTATNVTDMAATAAHTTTAVNLREGPSTAYTSKRVLPAGTSVTLTGKSGQWYRVNWGGTTGYIMGDYISTSSGQTGSSAGEKIVAEAKKYLGVPYVYGGTSPSGFDCSGFVYYTYKQCGYSITRTAGAQNSVGTKVARADLQPGDIIIFLNGAKTSIGHSGMYIGGGQFIHASSGGGKVMISNLSESYYNARFYSARRVVQ